MKELDLQSLLNSLPLLDKHAADLACSRITREHAIAASIRSVSDPATISKILNWEKPATKLGSCALFPFHDLSGKLITDAMETVIVDTVISLLRDDGGHAIFRGQSAAFTKAEALDMSVLGRDISNLFVLIVDRPRDLVCLLGAGHQYSITPST